MTWTAREVRDRSELEQILDLQRENLARSLSSEEAKSQGFVTAEHTLDRLHEQASPDVDRYHHALHQVGDLRDALRSHHTCELLDSYTITDRIPFLHQRLDALDTWWRFAKGDSVDATRLGEIVDILGTVDDDHGHCRWLADSVVQHCHDAGIHVATVQAELPGVQPAGLEISL